jgi:hypothetical protein
MPHPTPREYWSPHCMSTHLRSAPDAGGRIANPPQVHNLPHKLLSED